MKTKNEIRSQAKQIRKTLNLPVISQKISENLFNLDEFKAAQSVFTYISLPDEVDTSAILAFSDKNLYVPKIFDKNLIFSKYDSLNLMKNKYGIPEPADAVEVRPQSSDIIVIPALAADENFNRIGYGGGYYDRFLANALGIKVVLIPDKLLFKSVISEQHDIKADIIITESLTLYNNINNRKNHN
ncbi:MAG: 5-formyltetrahydrofolate cyclo-ligase [Candidatus Gastranaerophilales bacterium]|nr:5-formyltetrahydrofolate cyclo-ligase [Candidatus Gastranaerophilales bacterium]